MNRYLPRPVVLRLFFFVGFVWAAVAGPASAVLIMTHKGGTTAQIGIVMAVCAVISMVVQPVWGLLSDKLGSPRRVLCYCLTGSALFFGAIWFTDNFMVVAAFLFADIFFRCGVVALLDSHTLAEIKALPGLQYSHIRLAGSIFFGSLAFVYSRAIEAWDVMAVLPISVGIAAVAVLWGLLVARGRYETSDDPGVRRAPGNLRRDAAALLKNRPFILLIFFVALSALAMSPVFVFLIEFVTEVGGHPGHVPLIHALRCVVEIPAFMLVGTYGKRLRAKTLMWGGAAFTLVYLVGLLFANSFTGLALAHLAAGAPGFILLLTGRLRYVNDITPESVRSTSITLMGTFEIGLGAIIGNLAAGFVLGVHGTQALTAISLTAIVLGLGLLVFIPGKGEEK